MPKTKYNPVNNRYIEIDEETAKKLQEIKERREHQERVREKERQKQKKSTSRSGE